MTEKRGGWGTLLFLVIVFSPLVVWGLAKMATEMAARRVVRIL